VVVASVSQQIEDGQAALIHDDSFIIDNAGCPGQAADGIDSQRIPVGEVVAIAGDEPNPVAFLSRDDPKTVVLDLVDSAGIAPEFMCRF
jgi:hypothetical protein